MIAVSLWRIYFKVKAMALPISYNVRNLRSRWKVTLLAIGGIALVVAALVTILSMARGFKIALSSTGSDNNAIVTQRGSMSELSSWMNVSAANLVSVDPRIARGDDGKPLASCEVVVITARPAKQTGLPTNITFRGVTPTAFKVRNGIKIVEGRTFTPGLFEVIVGKKIADRLQGVEVGSIIPIQRKNWKVVGLFTADGSSFESEIWGDYDAMAPAIGRNGGCESLTARLTNPALLASFDKDLRGNPQFQLQADSEKTYYENLAGPMAGALMGLAAFVAVVMGIGAIFGAMNTMYAIVSQRTREIGTLRALGFSRFSILFSFVMESVLLAIVGGLLGCLVALPMNGFTAATGTNAFSELAFAFKVTPQLLIIGLIFAALMGVIGGLLPALRASRMPITRALREA